MNSLPLVALCSILACGADAASDWLTNFEEAKRLAQQNRKPILVNFTGSDWCGWCKRLKAEVFSQSAFLDYARDHLVLLEIDFPRQKPLPDAQVKANRQLGSQYRIQGYPTLLVLDSSGREMGRLGYQPGGVQPFLAKLQYYTGAPNAKPSGSAPSPAPSAFRPKTPTATSAQPASASTTTRSLPLHQGDLDLNGLSGTGKRRFAMINNHTFTEGEVGTITAKGKKVQVRCVEIRKDSVVINVGNDPNPQELWLRGH